MPSNCYTARCALKTKEGVEICPACKTKPYWLVYVGTFGIFKWAVCVDNIVDISVGSKRILFLLCERAKRPTEAAHGEKRRVPYTTSPPEASMQELKHTKKKAMGKGPRVRISCDTREMAWFECMDRKLIALRVRSKPTSFLRGWSPWTWFWCRGIEIDLFLYRRVLCVSSSNELLY